MEEGLLERRIPQVPAHLSPSTQEHSLPAPNVMSKIRRYYFWKSSFLFFCRYNSAFRCLLRTLLRFLLLYPTSFGAPWTRTWVALWVLGPAALISLGSFTALQNLGLQPRRNESESLGWGPEICVPTSPPGDSETRWSLRSIAMDFGTQCSGEDYRIKICIKKECWPNARILEQLCCICQKIPGF